MTTLTAAAKNFHWLDYVVFVLTIVVSLGIGVYFALSGDRQKTTGEYLTGNRQLKVSKKLRQTKNLPSYCYLMKYYKND